MALTVGPQIPASSATPVSHECWRPVGLALRGLTLQASGEGHRVLPLMSDRLIASLSWGLCLSPAPSSRELSGCSFEKVLRPPDAQGRASAGKHQGSQGHRGGELHTWPQGVNWKSVAHRWNNTGRVLPIAAAQLAGCRLGSDPALSARGLCSDPCLAAPGRSPMRLRVPGAPASHPCVHLHPLSRRGMENCDFKHVAHRLSESSAGPWARWESRGREGLLGSTVGPRCLTCASATERDPGVRRTHSDGFGAGRTPTVGHRTSVVWPWLGSNSSKGVKAGL